MLLKSILPFGGSKRSDYWAIQDFNFDVAQGETLGIIGRNGAGKTTLLRLLAGVTRPSSGRVVVRGRVAPLISVNVGFHPEMSGRENIFVNGILLGLTKRQVEQRLDEIIEFAELDSFIDTPIKFYSSGMQMRLGFSVVVHVDPEILLVDEILAVGDTAFQLKSFERMRHLQSSGTTIVMVSHSMHAIRMLCPRALLLRKGCVEFDGSSEDAIARHHELMTEEYSNTPTGTAVVITNRELISRKGPTHHPESGERVVFRATVEFKQRADSPQAYVHVVNEAGVLVYSIASVFGSEGRVYEPGDVATFEMSFVARLGPGTYRIMLTVLEQQGRDPLAHDSGGLVMFVSPRPGVDGVADLEGGLKIDGRDACDWGDFLISGGPSSREVADSPGVSG